MALRISESQIEEIREKNDIVSVVSEYVSLKRSGSNYQGLCPFHNDKRPSFSVSESRGIFKCFACGKGGNVFHFIMLAENLDFLGSVKFLAERAGVDIKYEGNAEKDDKSKLKNDILSLNERAQAFFRESLKRSDAGKEYVARRGLTPETVEKFGIGFAPDSWDQLTKICTYGPLGVSAEMMEAAGLAKKREKGDGCYDRFRNRVMFPIFDEMGKIVAFGGRVTDNSEPKYLNSPETAAYNKGSHLYALNFARRSGSKRVIIVEGYMDAIALHQKGIDWAVASLGTALTTGQARLLKRYFEEVIIGYDSDSAGQNATVRGLEILQQQGLRVRILKLAVVDPEVKDPDEFLRKHSYDDFMKVVDAAETLVAFKIDLAAASFPPSSEASLPDFLRRVVTVIAAEPSSAVRSVYIGRVAEKYGIDEYSLKQDVEARIAGGTELSKERVKQVYRHVRSGEDNAANTDEDAALSEDGKKLDRLEKRMIIFLADNSGEIPVYADDCRDNFRFEENKKLANLLHEWYINGYAVSREKILDDCSPGLASRLTDEFEHVGARTTAEEIRKNIDKFRFRFDYEQLQEKLRRTDDSAEKSVIIKQLNDLLLRERKRKN